MCTAGFPEPWTFSLRARRLLAARRGRLRPGPRQPVPGQRHPRDDGRRLAAADHAPPPDHRRPAAGPQPRHQPVAAVHPAPLVRLPAHAGQGGPGPAPRRHRVRVVEDRHRRPDGGRVVPDDRGAGRRRPHRVPAPRRRAAGARPDHGHLVVRRAHEGPGAPARGGGQAAHRAGRRAGGHRQPAARRPGGQGHRAARTSPRSSGA